MPTTQTLAEQRALRRLVLGTPVTGHTLTFNGDDWVAAVPGGVSVPGPSGSTSVAQGTASFGASGLEDYAQVVIPAAWVTAQHVVIPMVRGGTADHPLADEDAVIELLHATIVAINVGTSVVVGVHAPNATHGDYLVDILGAA